jgi:hypothetical protein
MCRKRVRGAKGESATAATTRNMVFGRTRDQALVRSSSVSIEF